MDDLDRSPQLHGSSVPTDPTSLLPSDCRSSAVAGAAAGDDRKGLGWLMLLPIACCGGPLLIVAVASAGAAAWGGAGAGVAIALALALVVLVRRRRAAACCAPGPTARYAGSTQDKRTAFP